MKQPILAAALLCSASLTLIPARSYPYTISTPLTDGCHESITSDALRAVRAELATAAPLPADENERALIDDLQFTPARDMLDLGGVTLLLGARDNDLKGRSGQDLTELAEVHGDPGAQHEHCLRAGRQDEPDGSAAALSSCRAFIRTRVQEALAGLDGSGKPDLGKRTTLGVYLALRHHVDAPLPTYYVRMGQALHAIQDSFTHTYRSADSMKITVVLNYLDQVDGNLVESRDGPAHATSLDRCDDPDSLRKTRHVLATAATTEILRATLDPQKTADEKMAAVDGVLDTYLSYAPGCTFANGWCNAPERQYKDPAGCGCTIGGRRDGGWTMLPGIALVGLGLARRRRRKQRLALQAGGALSLALFFAAAPARAQSNAPSSPNPPDTGEPTTRTREVPPRAATSTTPSKPAQTVTTTTIPGETPSTPPTTATKTVTPSTTTTSVTSPTKPDERKPPPPRLVPVPEPGPRDVSASAWGAFLGGSGSFDNPALAGTVGLRLRANNTWIFGLDGEWNPWIGHGTAIKPGVANLYATGILQLPLAYENFNLRSSLGLGGSRLLMNLYGAPKGSTGIFADVNFLGIAWKASRSFYVIINPVNIAIPVPQLKGVPLMYPQYRFTVGLEMYLG